MYAVGTRALVSAMPALIHQRGARSFRTVSSRRAGRTTAGRVTSFRRMRSAGVERSVGRSRPDLWTSRCTLETTEKGDKDMEAQAITEFKNHITGDVIASNSA